MRKILEKVYVGGQAVIEGVMMQAPTATALAVRKQNGEIHIEDFDMGKPISKKDVRSWPFIRGIFRMGKMLSIGLKAINRSADIAYPEEMGESSSATSAIAMILGIVLALVIFIGLPTIIADFLRPMIYNTIVMNIIEGCLRLAIFLLYLIAISSLKDIRRVFMYHGAEHKVVFCYERCEEITVENAKKQSRLHPRCGTSYLLIIVVLSILLFTFLGWSGEWYIRIGLRLLMLPIVIGLAYEILRVAAKHDSFIFRAIRFPGVQLQRLTTREPDDDMIEVSIAAFKRAMRLEVHADEGELPS